MTALPLRAYSLGDSAVTIAFGTERSAQLLQRIQATARSLEKAQLPHVEDIVPAYLALTVFYDPIHTTYGEISAKLLEACAAATLPISELVKPRHHVIPVRYDGMDLEAVAT
ncbi:MAG TPA: carboxyltransferase domain-containing protein, partial [Gemmatimonadaceae bacterium]|nr:carboxyltransferase domain-containing protein [Gemmatimonadaceae bacterium]